jgi:hypothetical protein
MSNDTLEISTAALNELLRKVDFQDKQRSASQARGIMNAVAGPDLGWASTMQSSFTPNMGKFMVGYRGSVTFTDLEIATIASLPDELLGKIVGAGARGGVNALYNPLYKLREMVVRIRTGSLLSGILLLDSNPNATAQFDALEVIAAAYDAWVSKGRDKEEGGIENVFKDTTDEKIFEQIDAEKYENFFGVDYDPVLKGLSEADTLNATALNAYRVADSQNIAIAVGVLSISLGKTLLRNNKSDSAYKFFVSALVATITEYLNQSNSTSGLSLD